jgi:hypothetical protein
MLPGETAKQNGDAAAFVRGEGAFHVAVKMRGLVESGDLAQPGTLGFEASLDLGFIFDLH